MKIAFKYSLLVLALTLGSSIAAHAHYKEGRPQTPPPAPEVDPSLAISGITLLAGTLTVARARRRKE